MNAKPARATASSRGRGSLSVLFRSLRTRLRREGMDDKRPRASGQDAASVNVVPRRGSNARPDGRAIKQAKRNPGVSLVRVSTESEIHAKMAAHLICPCPDNLRSVIFRQRNTEDLQVK